MSHIQTERFWDRQSAALFIALALVSASRLVMADWIDSLSVAQTLVFLGAILGIALGYSSFSRRVCIWMAAEYGILLIPLQLIRATERTEWMDKDMLAMFARMSDAIVLFFKNEPIYDPIFFLTLMAILFWNLGLYSGYQLTRHGSFLRAALPCGIAMLVVQAYDAQADLRVWALAVYLFLALILLARMDYLEHRIHWRRGKIIFTAEMERDISRVALTFAALAIFGAWVFPSALNSIAPAAQAWNRFTAPIFERLEAATSALDSPYRAPSNEDFYGATLALGSDAPTSKQNVLTFKVDKAEVIPARYYWRGRVYDQYLNGRWVTSELTSERFDSALDRVKMPYPQKGAGARFTVTMNFPKQELMYAPNGAVWIDRPSQILSAPAVDSARDLFAWMSSPSLTAGERYRIHALISNPTEEELRGAGEEYPQWVTDRYLQIPVEMESPLRELALRITESQENNYDKAQAITIFLRNEIEYAQKLTEKPPAEQDPMMWVLLEHKKGFCMYSASAEVLLLRSLGIPARMAVGFAQGEYNAARNRYEVARADAHAWPEVYFPNIGWVEFEPTGNQDSLSRPQEPPPQFTREEEMELSQPNSPDMTLDGKPLPTQIPPSAPSAGKNFLNAALSFLYPLLLSAFAALGIFVMRRYSLVDRLPVYLEGRYIQSGRRPPNWLKRWSTWANLQPMQRAFHTVDVSLRWMGHPQPAHATPQERAATLTEILPAAREAILALKAEHEATLFTAHAGNLERARRAAHKIIFETMRVRLKQFNLYNP